MAQTVIEVRTVRRGSRWVAVVSIDAPLLKAPISFLATSDVRDELGALKSLFGMNTDAATVASAVSRRKAIEKAVSYARNFAVQNPSYFGASISWAKDVLVALSKSNDLLGAARGGDKNARAKISEIYDKAHKKDVDSLRSAKLLQESARLLDEGRSTLKVKLEDSSGHKASVGHDIGTRPELLLPQARFNIGAVQTMDRHRYTPSMTGSFDDDHELVVRDPFQTTHYSSSDTRDQSN